MRMAILALALGALGASAAYADREAMVVGGYTMVPVRYLAESFGATVSYNTATKQVSVSLGAEPVLLTVDSPTAYVGGRPVRLESAATVIVGVTYVPVRFVCEQFGAKVNWDGPSRRVTVLHPKHKGPLVLVTRTYRVPPGHAKQAARATTGTKTTGVNVNVNINVNTKGKDKGRPHDKHKRR